MVVREPLKILCLCDRNCFLSLVIHLQIYDPGYKGILLRADEKWPERPVLPLMSQAIKRGHLKPSISHV